MFRPLSLAWLPAGLLLLSACAPVSEKKAQPDAAAAAVEDPYLWLEDVSGDEALAWVRAQNAESKKAIDLAPGFTALENDLLAILDSDEKIPFVYKQGEYFYNFWTDKQNRRGIWRRTTLDEYRKPSPAWETLIDVDALNAAENENWVWHGANCLRPTQKGAPYVRCLVSLSRGGADADVTREFDLERKSWIEGGFFRPEAKGSLSWIDENTVYVATDFGEGSMTSSGYARVVKEWKRGTPMTEAKVVYEGLETDMAVGAYHDDTPGFERDFVYRALAFYNNELFLRRSDELVKIDAPNSAEKGVRREWLTLELREPWTVGGKSYPQGALLAAKLDDYLAGKREFSVVFQPDEHSSLAGFGATKDYYFINVLEDVKNRIYMVEPGAGIWTRTPLPHLPAFGTVSIGAVDDEASNDFFMTVSDYLTPTSLYLGSIGGGEPDLLKQLPAFFDASSFAISQNFATSKDGTKVPYFMVARKDLALNGKNPTLLYGYGGFEISMTPGYGAAVGRGWLGDGGVYVVANIRGGGEYGPRWHQAALKQNRNRAYEDFAAVAQDLIARKITSPAHLGIQGGSNGGLLMGNMTVMYPELFGAVVCQVPLLDMKRYNKLLAGASWMAEYGDPDTDDWTFLQNYSPYHNVKADVKYPPVLFTTSTRDDRVHPGHARKMFALMKEQGHDVSYYENIEGGHGGAADNRQRAHMQALAYTFLKQRLFKN
ncbi:prolyl oligopeptidase family serine peptidase [Xanthomonadaceae bacterium JHOS43]|nr:prolyl oligopeptidase family serine peptidase [Xanthomonadaceae bacterium JHOS43]